jgi:DNA helicase-2/ATP-dependent DNA helicase PcrA
MAPKKKGENRVKEIYDFIPIRNVFRTTTIHSVKGETLDAVLLVSHKNKQSQGGHFSDWFREGNYNQEHIRFAYVACSRPKHILVLAIPKSNKNEIEKLNKIGFL